MDDQDRKPMETTGRPRLAVAPAAADTPPLARAPAQSVPRGLVGRYSRAMAECATCAAGAVGAEAIRLAVDDPAGVWWAGPASPAADSAELIALLDDPQLGPVTDLGAALGRGAQLPTRLGRPASLLVCVRLGGERGVSGTLCAFFPPGTAVGAQQLRALRSIARLAAMTTVGHLASLASARRRDGDRRAAIGRAKAEAERGRLLARDLHEGLANQLAGSAFLVQSLATTTRSESPSTSFALGNIGRQLTVAIGHARALAAQSLPYLMETHGLADALRLAIRRRTADGAMLSVITDASADSLLPPAHALCLLETAVALALIASGSAGPQRVTVRVRPERSGRVVRLSISALSAWYGPGVSSPPATLWASVRYLCRSVGAAVVAREPPDAEAWRRLDVDFVRPLRARP